MYSPQDITIAISRVEQRVASVRDWMCQKSLKMNDSKTEILLITSKQVSQKLTCPSVSIADHLATPSDVARSVGVLLDKHASIEQHITATCKSAQYHFITLASN